MTQPLFILYWLFTYYYFLDDLRYKGICALEDYCEPENWVIQVKINSNTDLGVTDSKKLIEG